MEESSPWYKLYGYGLCKEKPTSKIAGYKVQYLHFRYLKFLVMYVFCRPCRPKAFKKTSLPGIVDDKLGGGFKHFLFLPLYLGKIPIFTNIFQMGWNHQLVNH